MEGLETAAGPGEGTVRRNRLEPGRAGVKRSTMTKRSPFRYFKTSPEIIRLAVMMYIWFPLSRRNVEDLLHERGIDISHETVRFWWNRFGPLFAAEIRRRRVDRMRSGTHWQWHLTPTPLSLSGVSWAWHKGQLHCPCRDWFAFV